MNTRFPSIGRSTKIATIASCLALMTAACSDTSEPVVVPEHESAELATAGDGDWIRLDGEVVASTPGTPDSFVLDYGNDNITVEADDWDIEADGIALFPGDRVSVTGRVDKGLFNTETIEAASVYIRNLNTVFYASPADEEQLGLAAAPLRPVTDGINYTGWVTGKSGDDFTLGAGPTKITVTTDTLDSTYNSSGIASGDRVYVWGDLTIDASGDSKLAAKGLIELVNSSATKAKQAPSTQGVDDDGKTMSNEQS